MSENNYSKSCKLYIEGMHCASCEILIEKKLLKKENVNFVDASLKNGEVEIQYHGHKPDIEKLNQDFAEQGYRFSKFKPAQTSQKLFKHVGGGKYVINYSRLGGLLKVFTVIAALLGLFYLFEKMQLGRLVSVDSSSAIYLFFMLGVVAGLSSCAALIGGLLLSLIKSWHELYIDSESNSEKMRPHIMFHTGRLLSYFILGGLLGLLGQAISFGNATSYSFLVVVVSAVMFILAMQMLGISWAQKIRFTLPKFITRKFANEDNFKGKFMPFAVGSLTFFLPCGFTLMAQGIALTSGSFIKSALIMLFFALGTLPTLLAISFSGIKFTKKPHMTARFNLVAGFVIVFFVIYNINGQLNVMGYPSLSDFMTKERTVAADNLAPVDPGQTQTLAITAKEFDYIPTSSTTLTAGVPTTMIVDNQGILGCGASMAARGLIDGFVNLKPGINEIKFTPSAGSYKLTCSMGMVRPVTITVI